jgi:demethylspheroidene O-methyltransferase
MLRGRASKVADVPIGGQPAPRREGPGLAARLASSPRFHAICARIPGLKHIARAEGRALFGLVSGFAQSQALLALVELRVLHILHAGPATDGMLARRCDLGPDRMRILLQAGAAMKLLYRKRGLWHLSARGAAFLTVPGLEAMVRHHGAFYRDLADPVALLRGGKETGLSQFWPYVFGAGGATDPGVTALYSGLMADSQGLVAADTLGLVDFRGIRHLMDVGGGTGAFLRAVGAAHPHLQMTLFDLPAVVAGAQGLGPGVSVHPGSFRDDPLPLGADAISLVRVLYDHADATVLALLAKVHAALPEGGRVIVSEPMSGGAKPDPATDVYFALYTLAMQTGRTRPAAEIADMLRKAGFSRVSVRPGFRSFVTSVVVGTKD